MAKKNNNEGSKKVEQFVKNVQYNRENVPGFDSLYKLILWFIFIFVLLVLFMAFGRDDNKNGQQQTTTIPANAISYKALLDERIKDGSSYLVKFNYKNVKSTYECRVEATIKENTIEGLVENINGLEKFRIKDGKYYKIQLDEEIEKDDYLFDLDIVNLVNLIKLLESNKSLKTVDQETNIINYKYDLVINDIAYEINSQIKDKKITSISVKNENSSYEISFK